MIGMLPNTRLIGTAWPQVRALVALGAICLSFSIVAQPISAQAKCNTSTSAAAQLLTLFAGFLPHDVGSYSLMLGQTTCNHKFEQKAKDPTYYDSCETW